MHLYSEATQLLEGSLATFLAGPVINRDNDLSKLAVHAESFRETPFLIYSYPQQRTLHISEGILSLSGYSAKEVCDGGIELVIKFTNPDDLGYMTLLQTALIQEAKAPGFDPRSIRFHDYYWSLVHRNGTKIPLASTSVMLTYSPQQDFGICVGFFVRNDKNCDLTITRCKDILKRIKERHNQIHMHTSTGALPGLYPIHYVNHTTESITQRERQVLGMLAQGHSTEIIAGALSIAANTVESHRKKLLQKFDARNSAELIKKASKVFWLS